MPVREAEQSPYEHPCFLTEAPRSHINATLNTGLCSYNHMVIFVHLALQPQMYIHQIHHALLWLILQFWFQK